MYLQLQTQCFFFSFRLWHEVSPTTGSVFLFIFQTAEWIKSAAVKSAHGPGSTSLLPNGFVFLCLWLTAHVFGFAHRHTHTHGPSVFMLYAFLFFLPTSVSTRSRHLWDYWSPFVFQREPSWLKVVLRREPSGLYSTFPHHILTIAFNLKERSATDSSNVYKTLQLSPIVLMISVVFRLHKEQFPWQCHILLGKNRWLSTIYKIHCSFRVKEKPNYLSCLKVGEADT